MFVNPAHQDIIIAIVQFFYRSRKFVYLVFMDRVINESIWMDRFNISVYVVNVVIRV